MINFLFLTTFVASYLPYASGFSLRAGRSAAAKAKHFLLDIHVARTTITAATLAGVTTTQLLSYSNEKQAEIAALEERLRQLKEDLQEEESPSKSTESDSEELDGMEGQTVDSIMFSERWKEADTSVSSLQNSEVRAGEVFGGIIKAALAFGLVVFLALFSQVPMGGENLQRYQDLKGNSGRIDLGDLNPGVRVQ